MSDDANPLEKITRERDEARAAADEWRARAESADKGYGQSFEEKRDEARAQLATLREAATPIYDRDLSADERRAWWDRLERTLADIEAAVREHEARLRAEVQRAEQERDEARAQLAALREAVMTLEWGTAARACSDLAASAREHETRIRAKALREAAERIESTPPTLLASASDWQRWLCEMADEAEKESR